ncbi:MAG: hypothetical protein ABJA90_06520 [Ginsengibacter sp.]
MKFVSKNDSHGSRLKMIRRGPKLDCCKAFIFLAKDYNTSYRRESVCEMISTIHTWTFKVQ